MPTKIAPSRGSAGEDFTIIDTPAGRLAAGSMAVFLDPISGTRISVPLSTHRPHMTAQGKVPALSGGVTYQVNVEVDGTSFPVGTFQAGGTALVAPTITPSQGPVGTDFTIDDAAARMAAGDQAIFYVPGADPSTGTPATAVNIVGGSVLSGQVPVVPAGVQYYVAVVCPSPWDVRFQGLPFLVTI